MAKWAQAQGLELRAGPLRRSVVEGGGMQSMGRAGQVWHGRRRAVWALALSFGLGFGLVPQLADAQMRPKPRPTFDAPAPAAVPAHPQARPKPRKSDGTAAGTQTPILRGAVTKQPLPRYVSLKGSEGNARRGPGLTHRIDWVFTTKGTPLKVTAEYENWRRVEDFEGFGGWVHFTLLSVARTVLVTTDMAQFHSVPDPNAPIAFQAERGVLARLLECHIDWCRVNAEGQRGWAPKSALWGVDPNEVVQ